MGQEDRLGGLRVGVGRHGGVRGILSSLRQRPLEVQQQPIQPMHGIQEPEPLIGDDLLVAAAPGLELPGELGADLVAHGSLDVHVHVLASLAPGEGAALDLASDRRKGSVEPVEACIGQKTKGMQLLNVDARCGDVVERQGAVDIGGARQHDGDRGQRRSDAAPPEGSINCRHGTHDHTNNPHEHASGDGRMPDGRLERLAAAHSGG